MPWLMSCLIFACITISMAQQNIQTYGQIRKNAYEALNHSIYSYSSSKKVARQLGHAFDMEEILKTVYNPSKDPANYTDVSDAYPASASFLNPSMLKGLLPLLKDNAQCLIDVQSVIQGLQNGDQAAIGMIDAMAKPPSGILSGATNWPGAYDECHMVKTDKFDGKYCLVTMYTTLLKSHPMTINAGICMPSSCQEADILTILKQALPQISNKTVFPYAIKCPDPDPTLDTRAIVVIVILSNLGVVMVVATIYDIVIRKLKKQKKTEHNTGVVNVAYIGNMTLDERNNSNETKSPSQEPQEIVNVDEETVVEHNPGTAGKLLLSFSLYTNTEKILNTTQGSGTLTAVNGIRFISMTWVILGHTFAFGLSAVDNLGIIYPKFIQRKSFMAILNAEVSVDSFFALSGTLLAYLVLQQLQKEKGKINWFLFYFHRFWRLTPPYMFVLMIFAALFAYIGDGPFWHLISKNADNCHTNWWYNLLYINNFVKETDECFGWAWYLANDMQFFVISPLFLLTLFYSKIIGGTILGMFWLGSAITTGLVSRHYPLGITQSGPHAADYFDKYYQRPYTRIGPYLVGILCGYLLYITKRKCHINKYVNLVLWAVFTVISSAALYGVYRNYNGHEFSTDLAATFNTLHRTAWSLGVCWVIFACATGNGGIINTFLSWKAFVPLGRLTYCAYLVHPIIMFYFVGSRKKLLHWDIHEIIYEYLGNLGLSYACAFVASLAFEAPMMGLEKVLLKRGEKKK